MPRRGCGRARQETKCSCASRRTWTREQTRHVITRHEYRSGCRQHTTMNNLCKRTRVDADVNAANVVAQGSLSPYVRGRNVIPLSARSRPQRDPSLCTLRAAARSLSPYARSPQRGLAESTRHEICRALNTVIRELIKRHVLSRVLSVPRMESGRSKNKIKRGKNVRGTKLNTHR